MDEDLRRRYRRDFTKEKIETSAPSPSPVTKAEFTPLKPSLPEIRPLVASGSSGRSRRKKSKKILKRVLITLVALSILAGLAFGGRTYYNQRHKNQYFPAAIKKKVQTAIYYPVGLPAEFKVNDDFRTPQSNVMTYSITDRKNNKYVVAIQPLPSNFQLNDQKAKMTNPDSFNTDYGTAAIGITVDGLLALVRTNDNSLIIIHGLNNDTQSQVETIVRSLKVSS